MTDRCCYPGSFAAGGPRSTESLCPVCLAKVPATLDTAGEVVTLEGRCPDHGAWRTPIWSGPPSFDSWGEIRGGGSTGKAAIAAGSVFGGCPGECGLCPQHEQRTCTAVIEVTRRCDLECPVCFAAASPGSREADATVADLRLMLDELLDAQGPVNLQLSGGEPTTRSDLPEIIHAAREAGFTFVQLNTNGLRLASDPGYAERLRDAGLSSVFLQFDGLTDDVYGKLRGRPLLSEKQQAVEACARLGVGVVLVATVVRGVNEDALGSIVAFAAERPGTIRGVHLQPISYFGRYPDAERPRMTLPELLRELEQQTGGQLQVQDFAPSGCEHVRCSFRARYWVSPGRTLQVIRSAGTCHSSDDEKPGEAARRAIAATARQWGGEQSHGAMAARPRQYDSPRSADTGLDDLSRFLDGKERILAVSGMLFQDAWSIDLERIRRCCVHAVVPGRGLVPFCLWNLTSESGHRLYPRG